MPDFLVVKMHWQLMFTELSVLSSLNSTLSTFSFLLLSNCAQLTHSTSINKTTRTNVEHSSMSGTRMYDRPGSVVSVWRRDVRASRLLSNSGDSTKMTMPLDYWCPTQVRWRICNIRELATRCYHPIKLYLIHISHLTDACIHIVLQHVRLFVNVPLTILILLLF